MKHARWLAVFAWVQCALVALTAVGWMWSAAWHASSVEAMSDEIVRKGLVDTGALDGVIVGYASLGAFLRQGWCGAVRV